MQRGLGSLSAGKGSDPFKASGNAHPRMAWIYNLPPGRYTRIPPQ